MSRVEMLIRSPPLSKHETSFLKEANVFFAGFNIGIEWRPPFPARRRRVNECLSFLDRWRSFFRCHTKPSTYGRDANAAFAMNCRQLSDLTLAEASFYGDWLDNYSKKKTIQSNRLVTAVGIFWDLLTRKLFHNRTNLYLLLGSKNTLEFQNSLLIPWFKRFFWSLSGHWGAARAAIFTDFFVSFHHTVCIWNNRSWTDENKRRTTEKNSASVFTTDALKADAQIVGVFSPIVVNHGWNWLVPLADRLNNAVAVKSIELWPILRGLLCELHSNSINPFDSCWKTLQQGSLLLWLSGGKGCLSYNTMNRIRLYPLKFFILNWNSYSYSIPIE